MSERLNPARLPVVRLGAGASLPARLPAWPLFLMFGLVPLWWVLGLFYLAWPLFGLLLLAMLGLRGRVGLPPGTVIWLCYLGLVLLSFSQLPQATAVLTAGLRFSFYTTALVVCVYVYQAARDARARDGGDRLVPGGLWSPLCLFWLALVSLGWLGVLAPQLSLTSLAQALLPSALSSEPFVRDLVQVATTEPQALAVNPTYRPSAPFPYTNTWGSAYAVLVPCVLAYLSTARTGALRWVLLVSIPLSLVPAYLTLNRGMFLSLGVGLLVVAVRGLWQGDPRRFLAIGGLLALGWLASLAIPVADLIEDRVANSGTNEGRRWLYEQALRGVAESPLLGHGAPATVDVMDVPPVGTQGQLWTVVFSHGVPALICFVAWFVMVGWYGRTGRSPGSQWLFAVPVVALVQLPFYGLTFHNLSAVGFAAALLLADSRARVPRPVVHPGVREAVP